MALRTNVLIVVLCAGAAGSVMPVAGQSAAGRAIRHERSQPATTTADQRMVSIPAGSFMPLYDEGDGRVRVAAFRLDRYPVTRAQYAAFRRLPAVRAADADRPVTSVTRPEATAYCAARGARLATENEWEYAAAASATRREGRGDPAFRQQLLDLYTRKRDSTPDPVGSTFRNAYGIYDMHGLVWEWVAPAHHHHPAQKHDMSCAGSARGATDTSDFAAFLRLAFRSGLADDMRQPGLGFRCAA